jgi:hypothetical protein
LHTAQTRPLPDVRHRSWKAFYSKIPDSVTLRFDNDSAAVVGDALIQAKNENPFLFRGFRRTVGVVVQGLESTA